MEEPSHYSGCLDDFEWTTMVIAPENHYNKTKIIGRLTESFQSMTCNNCFESVFAIDLQNQDLLCKAHFERFGETGEYEKVENIWNRIQHQSDEIEQELMLMECIKAYWENKGKYSDIKYKEVNQIQEMCTQIIITLKHLISELIKVEEIFNLDAYKLWIEHQKQLTNLFAQIHCIGGIAISRSLSNKILDEILYIAGDESRLTEIEKLEFSKESDSFKYGSLFGRSFDICTLFGSFEKPLGDQKQALNRLTKKQQKVIQAGLESQIEYRFKYEDKLHDEDVTVAEIKDQLKKLQDFILTLRDTPTVERGSEIVHFIKTNDLEKPPNMTMIRDLIVKYNIDPQPIFNEDYKLEIDLKLNKDSMSFINGVNKCKFNNYRKLSIRNISYLQYQDSLSLSQFFSISTPNSLQILYLHGGEDLSISAYLSSLPSLLRITSKQIYLDMFSLCPDSLKLIIENSCRARELILNYCKVTKLSTSFTIDSGIDFKISRLDLYGTFNPQDEGYLSATSLKILAKAMGKAKIKDSLKHLHVFDEAMEKKEVEKIMEFYGLKVEVKANGRWAKSKE